MSCVFGGMCLLYKFHLDEESVKTEGGNAKNECRHYYKLHGMFAEVVIGLAIRKLATHKSADKESEK